MANKPSPNSLIHCAECGEDYSATYKRCPFCGAKNSPQQSASDRPAPPTDLDDTYVFDGQDLFDDADGEDYAPASSRGGKRLAEKPMSNPFANADINWPRVITFVCSLVIIVAAMIIVFTVIYPQLRGNPTTDNSENPSSSSSVSPSSSATEPGHSTAPSTVPSSDVSSPPPSPSVTPPVISVPPSSSTGLTALTFNRTNDADFTLTPGESHTIKLVFTPASWSGTVTWTSSNPAYATVDSNGKVTNVNTSGTLQPVTITASAGGLTLTSKVFCRSAATGPSPSPTQSSSPSPSPSGSGSGTVTVGKKGVIADTVTNGVFVRSTPSKSNGDNRIASLFKGDPINVLEDAGNGWYKISFAGPGGVTTEGYIEGEWISTD